MLFLASCFFSRPKIVARLVKAKMGLLARVLAGGVARTCDFRICIKNFSCLAVTFYIFFYLWQSFYSFSAGCVICIFMPDHIRIENFVAPHFFCQITDFGLLVTGNWYSPIPHGAVFPANQSDFALVT